jgi:hypothetical protein
MAWNDLTLSDKARMMQLAVRSGITDLRDIQQVYNTYAEGGPKKKLINRINNTSKANFVQRLKDPNRAYIPFGNGIATHRMSYATEDDSAIVYPEIQEIDGQLQSLEGREALESAIARGDTLRMSIPEAEWFTKNYKKYYPKGNTFKEGGPKNKKYPKPISWYVQQKPELYPNINKIRPEYLDKYFTIDETGTIKDITSRAAFANKRNEVRNSTGTIKYNQDNEIMLTTDGANARYRTGRISTDLLDYIYDNAAKANIPFKEAVGLAGKESTLGIGRGYKRGASVSPIDLYSFWHGVGDSVKTNKEMNKLNSIYVKMYNGEVINEEDLAAAEKEYQKLYDNLHPFEGNNLVKEAYDYYKAGKYNPGEKGYNENVLLQGEAILQDKAVQEWLKKKKSYKGRGFNCGGKLYTKF